MIATELRTCPECGEDVIGNSRKVYCSERCSRRAEKKRYGKRRRARLAAKGLTSRGNPALRDEVAKQLSQDDRDAAAGIDGKALTDNDLGAYRRAVLRDPCSYCGGKADTADHILPKSFVRDNSWSNLTAACRSCNTVKSNTTLLSFLLRRPTLTEINRLADLAARDTIKHQVNYVRKNHAHYVKADATT